MARIPAIQHVTLTAGVWTPVTPPFTCDHAKLVNRTAVTISLRMVDTEATSQIDLLSGETWPLDLSVGSPRYSQGEPAFYLQPASGVGPAVVIWS